MKKWIGILSCALCFSQMNLDAYFFEGDEGALLEEETAAFFPTDLQVHMHSSGLFLNGKRNYELKDEFLGIVAKVSRKFRSTPKFSYFFKDGEGNLLMKADVDFFTWGTRAEIFDSNGEKIGGITQQSPTWYLPMTYSLMDEQDHIIANGNWNFWGTRFSIFKSNSDDQPIAQFKMSWLSQLFSSKLGNFEILDEDSDVDSKMVAFLMTFSLDGYWRNVDNREKEMLRWLNEQEQTQVLAIENRELNDLIDQIKAFDYSHIQVSEDDLPEVAQAGEPVWGEALLCQRLNKAVEILNDADRSSEEKAAVWQLSMQLIKLN